MTSIDKFEQFLIIWMVEFVYKLSTKMIAFSFLKVYHI